MPWEMKKKTHYVTQANNFYVARVRFHDRSFHIYYNVLTEHLIIHEWYDLEHEDLLYLQDELNAYFEDLAQGEER